MGVASSRTSVLCMHQIASARWAWAWAISCLCPAAAAVVCIDCWLGKMGSSVAYREEVQGVDCPIYPRRAVSAGGVD